MPLYDYQCPKCQQVTEVRRGFDDLHSESCPNCGSMLKRVFNPAPILFKGSGFYVTDSRKSPAPASTEKTPDAKSDTKTDAKTDAKTDTKTDAKTGAKPADTSTAPASTPADPVAPATAAPTKESAA